MWNTCQSKLNLHDSYLLQNGALILALVRTIVLLIVIFPYTYAYGIIKGQNLTYDRLIGGIFCLLLLATNVGVVIGHRSNKSWLYLPCLIIDVISS